MFDALLHAVLGNTLSPSKLHPAMNAASQANYGNTITTGSQKILPPERAGRSERLFDGRVEVLKVANGYLVNIGRREGYEYETHIASSIAEVNEIIAAQIVAFRLEDKS